MTALFDELPISKKKIVLKKSLFRVEEKIDLLEDQFGISVFALQEAIKDGTIKEELYVELLNLVYIRDHLMEKIKKFNGYDNEA